MRNAAVELPGGYGGGGLLDFDERSQAAVHDGAAKCHYCDFFSVAAEGHDRGAMVAAILREAELWAPRSPRTVIARH